MSPVMGMEVMVEVAMEEVVMEEEEVVVVAEEMVGAVEEAAEKANVI